MIWKETAGFLVCFAVTEHRCIEFYAYRILYGSSEQDWEFERKGAVNPMIDSIKGLPTSDCLCFLRGHVKPDGCMDFCFPEAEEVMLHTCGRAGVQQVSDLLLFVHDQSMQMLQLPG